MKEISKQITKQELRDTVNFYLTENERLKDLNLDEMKKCSNWKKISFFAIILSLIEFIVLLSLCLK